MPEVTHTRAVGHGPRLLVVLLVVVAVAFVGWSWSAHTRVPAPSDRGRVVDAVGGALSSDVAAAPAAVDAPSSDEPERTSEAGSASIAGVLLDSAGQPLVGWRILLRPKGSRPVGDVAPAGVETGENGQFQFRDLDAGAYELRLDRAFDQDLLLRRLSRSRDPALSVLELAAGEARQVEVRLPPDCAAVSGFVTKRGKAAAGCVVHVTIAPDQQRFVHVDGQGTYRCVLPAGRHRVDVRAERGSSGFKRQAGPLVWCERELVVPAAAGTVRWDIDLAVTVLELVVVEGASVGDYLHFQIAGHSDVDRDFHTFEVDTANCRAEVEVPPGKWTIGVLGRGLVAQAPHVVEVPAGLPHLRLEFTVVPAGIVRMAFEQPGGRPFYLPTNSPSMLALLPEIVAGPNRLPCRMIPAPEGPLTGAALPGYENVPIGPATLQAQDRVQDGALVHLPFDPIESVAIEVAPGRRDVVVPVQPRAFVTLIACGRGGGEDSRGRIKVFRGDTLVQPACSPQQARWQAFLPPGEYRVVIDRENGPTEDRLFVDRASMVVRLQP